jgi:hypothetical protein
MKPFFIVVLLVIFPLSLLAVQVSPAPALNVNLTALSADIWSTLSYKSWIVALAVIGLIGGAMVYLFFKYPEAYIVALMVIALLFFVNFAIIYLEVDLRVKSLQRILPLAPALWLTADYYPMVLRSKDYFDILVADLVIIFILNLIFTHINIVSIAITIGFNTLMHLPVLRHSRNMYDLMKYMYINNFRGKYFVFTGLLTYAIILINSYLLAYIAMLLGIRFS